jgi:hypothetical protein
MSARALCMPCAKTRNGESVDQLMAGEGPYYDEWRKAMLDLARRLVTS